MKRLTRLVALLSVFALVVAACEESPTDGEGEGLKVCFVTDDAGVDDRSFNAAGWQGVQDAVASGAALDDDTFPILLESTSEADYQPHVESCLAAGSEHIVTSGFKLAGTTETFAEANPEVQWTIIDFGSLGPNVTGLEYQTDEGAFAAGYLAAGMTQTGVVATYGGVDIPTVTIFMDGFARGVAHYNDIKGTDVQVLGWDVDAKQGTMTGTFDPAEPAVRATCESQLDENADIILPVGGAINLPCGEAMIARGLDAALIGVDSDAFAAMPEQYQDLWLVTILKGIAIQVQRSVEAHADGNPTGGSSSVGNLENGAIALSSYHSWADRVPADLDAEVQQILSDIADGTITWDKFVVGGG
ncbi:MAG: BMP family ABC transporter substrate-binding protein [Acidimicrobiia bacterium]|nr:BMP family ABC transporter substrate-binding protein [Acidimicrobiia bacterium]